MIGVDVLSDQRDFANAGAGKPLDVGENLRNRPRCLHAARVGHDAEGAELVAAFLHGDESSRAARAHRRGTRRSQMIELVVDRKLGVDRAAVARGARQQIRQAVIALRADHEIDHGGAAENFCAFGLCHASGDSDGDAASAGGGFFLDPAHAAEFGIDLLGGLLADVAGVENDEVGVVGARGLDIALRRQGVRHTLRVVDVHLAAERFDVEFFRVLHAWLMQPKPL